MKWSSIHTKWLNYLWVPDIYITHAKDSNIRKAQEEQALLALYDYKRFWYELPVQITLNCPLFDFSAYPLDQQTCKFFMGGYRYTDKENVYQGRLVYNKSNQRAIQYDVLEIKPLSSDESLVNYTTFYQTSDGEWNNVTDSYSHFAVEMKFRRLFQPHLICTYLPSFLLVMTSWLGFLTEPSCIPGRIALSLMVLLVLMNMR